MTDEELRRAEHRLLAGAATYACGGYIARLDALHRNDLYTRLAYDRLERKYDVVRELFAESDSNWNQTFYVLLFRTIGDVTNRDAFLTLARRVSYRMVLRERASLHAVEAMLIGASGLLDNYRDDAYTRSLKQDFDYFSRKYEIAPMTGAEWNLRDIRPANHPLLRIAQLAAFLASNDFLIDRLVECRTAEEVRRLFSAEASDYWYTHYIPATPTRELPKRIGRMKSDLLGINLVSLIQYAYGAYNGNGPSRCSKPFPPRRTASCAAGVSTICIRPTPSSRRHCCNWPPNTATGAAARSVRWVAAGWQRSDSPSPPTNPSADIDVMTLRIENKSCIACGKCVQVCPAGIMVRSTDGKGIEAVRTDRCIGCGHCVDVCPTGSVIHSDFPPQRVHTVDTGRLPAPEQVLELIRARRSNRALTPHPIPDEALQRIVEAARYAPTASNSRQVSFTLVTEPEQLLRIADFTVGVFASTARKLLHPVVRTLLKPLRPDLYRYAARFAEIEREHEAGNDPILRRATALLIIHTPASNRFGCEDANLAYQNASLMAESLGVSQIYMGFVLTAARMGRKNAFARIAGITGRPQAIMALGIPAFRYSKYTER